jgi:hypothetical protein
MPLRKTCVHIHTPFDGSAGGALKRPAPETAASAGRNSFTTTREKTSGVADAAHLSTDRRQTVALSLHIRNPTKAKHPIMSPAHGTLESGVRGDIKTSPLDARRPVFHVSRDHGFTCSPIEAKAAQIGGDRSETMHDLVEGELDIDSFDPSSARTASTSGRWPYRQSLDVLAAALSCDDTVHAAVWRRSCKRVRRGSPIGQLIPVARRTCWNIAMTRG